MATPESTLINQHIQKQLNRQRLKSLKTKIVVFVFLTLPISLLILFGVNLYFNSGKLGFREKVMSEYNFSNEVKWYIRLHTNFQIGSRTGGFGEGNHAGLFNPFTRTVSIATANDGLALEELSHAWWTHQLDLMPEKKDNLIKDTIKLSQMQDERYNEFAIPVAKGIIQTFCKCPDKNNISSVDEVDAQHFFITWVWALEDRWDKDWQKYLPEFMWKYFDNFFEPASSHL